MEAVLQCLWKRLQVAEALFCCLVAVERCLLLWRAICCIASLLGLVGLYSRKPSFMEINMPPTHTTAVLVPPCFWERGLSRVKLPTDGPRSWSMVDQAEVGPTALTKRSHLQTQVRRRGDVAAVYRGRNVGIQYAGEVCAYQERQENECIAVQPETRDTGSEPASALTCILFDMHPL